LVNLGGWDVADGSLWRNRDFRLVLGGGLINNIGDWLLTLALPVFVFTESGSGRNAAAVFLVELIVGVCLGPMAAVSRIAGTAPAALNLEITETTLMGDLEKATATLSAIDALGVTLSVDDFGTGFSSLTYLRELPVTQLKIDRSFITAVTTDRRDASIVKSTIDLAHALGVRVVAEGVEDATSLTLLRHFGCDEAQGFHLCIPLPAADLTAWIQDHVQQLRRQCSRRADRLVDSLSS
jgi:EAL domain-containing protein (putative c-di-GMP-specific phosphodiesterase class I)